MNDEDIAVQERAHQIWIDEGRPEGRAVEHWCEAERQLRSGRNEGEGSQTGARDYNESTREFVETGWVEAAAQEAADALDDPGEGAQLRAAEEKGKSRSHGED